MKDSRESIALVPVAVVLHAVPYDVGQLPVVLTVSSQQTRRCKNASG
jgi:hypothetical protein